jgi:hypothetical protein
MMPLRNWSHNLNKERKSQAQVWGCRSPEFNKMAKGFIQGTGTVILKIKKDVQDGGNI